MNSKTGKTGKKILLALCPLWDISIPPLGIASLKSYLCRHGFNAKVIDINADSLLRERCNAYINRLKPLLSPEKIGNYRNLAPEILSKHLQAYLHKDREDLYLDVVRKIIYHTFYHELRDEQIHEVDDCLRQVVRCFETYFTALLQEEKPGILGLSVYSDTLPFSCLAFRLAKKWNPGIITLMGGGIFANYLAPGSENLDYFLERTEAYIDKVFIGESEILLLKYLENELSASQRVYSLADIKGEYFNIAKAGNPDYSDINLAKYQTLGFYCSRSCPAQCTFCSETVSFGKFRMKNMRQAARDLKELYEAYRYQLFMMGDSLLNPVITGLTRELSKQDVFVYFDGYLRADKHVMNTENTFFWRKHGFYRARMGVESGSKKILDLMRKGISPEQILLAVSALAKAGIKTTTYWVIGYPGETEEDFRMTLDLVEELKDDIYEADCNPFVYFPTGQAGTGLWPEDMKDKLLYPPAAKGMMLAQTRHLDCEPDREEIFKRVNRFLRHIKKLGIPNPYSLKEICEADKRWQVLHKNAVPMLVELTEKSEVIKEARDLKKVNTVKSIAGEAGDYAF